MVRSGASCLTRHGVPPYRVTHGREPRDDASGRYCPCRRRGVESVRVHRIRLHGRGWSAVILVATDLFDYLDWQQQRPRAGAGKVVRLTPQAPCRRAAGPPTTSAARGVGGARRRGVPGRPAHQPRPGHHAADAAGWAARRGGPLVAAGERGHGLASCPRQDRDDPALRLARRAHHPGRLRGSHEQGPQPAGPIAPVGKPIVSSRIEWLRGCGSAFLAMAKIVRTDLASSRSSQWLLESTRSRS